ncbi:Na+/H+ antiporter NhaC [Salegentibacter salegens]|uniref:Transporter, NhaC family n=1 Tax=Salegentibacter salegens TaxID=143223 RepID=A0A1M7JX28_9FLAO|nr:Na+/H+ antiporter NhaC [Salegentibacter salegens]PRX51973.1 NhaC family Na+:H+ antiporter [Salegentibacter salegens]SHM57569.1 transporter, NhaC family [Salegentibacter salegens]
MENQNPSQAEQIPTNKELGIWPALIPVFALIAMLAFNVFVFGDDSLSGSNQFVLLLGGAVAAVVGYFHNVEYDKMIDEVAGNIQSTAGAILILLMVGALAGTWLISGIIPTMIYYGLQILNPTIFLAACVVICAVISVATGSSWTTSATVGIALIGIAEALGISVGMTAGAILSGAYFGDKLSPLSDTTNLAPAMAGTDLFTHIRYMTLTTVPTVTITLIIFVIIGLNLDTSGTTDTSAILASIENSFKISPWLFLVPVIVIALIVKKTSPLIALLLGTLLGAAAALFFQPDIVAQIAGTTNLDFVSGYRGVMQAITVETAVETDNENLNDLFSAGGMAGMLGTIWLIICAMVFGGIMEAIGALARISKALLNLFHTTFGLFASTVFSCLALNATASDQYLAIVVPGKMFAKAYRDKGLAPENLSRTLEDSGTVTSVLIPWNTCGAYHSGVLGVPTLSYAGYAFFNYLSPFMTLLFAAFSIKIKELSESSKTQTA